MVIIIFLWTVIDSSVQHEPAETRNNNRRTNQILYIRRKRHIFVFKSHKDKVLFMSTTENDFNRTSIFLVKTVCDKTRRVPALFGIMYSLNSAQ